MKEIGIDIGTHNSKPCKELVDMLFDVIVIHTESPRDTGHNLAEATTYVHRPFTDPRSSNETGDEILAGSGWSGSKSQHGLRYTSNRYRTYERGHSHQKF